MRAWVWIAAIVAIVALPIAVALPLGGLEDARSRGPATIGLGETVVGNRVKITPEGVTYSSVDPTEEPSEFSKPERGRFLVLTMAMENVSHESLDLFELNRTLRLRVDGEPVARTDPMDRAVLRDRNDRAILHPGMPEKVRFVWELRKPDPERVALSIRDEVYKESWSLLSYHSGTSLWYRDSVMAVLEAEVGS